MVSCDGREYNSFPDILFNIFGLACVEAEGFNEGRDVAKWTNEYRVQETNFANGTG